MALTFRTLETSRLVLRPIDHGDDGAFLRIFSNPDTMKYWSREPLSHLEEAEKMVQEEIDWGQSGKCLNWGVALRGTNELIGKAVLEKFGFRREGYSRDRFLVHGDWHDSVVLGLLETDYREALSRGRG